MHKVFILLYTLPQMYNYMRHLNGSSLRLPLLLLTALIFLAIFVAEANYLKKNSTKKISYSLPFKTAFSSFGIFIILATIFGLLTSGLSMMMANLPFVIHELILSSLNSIIPLIIAIIYIYIINRKRSNHHDEILDLPS